MLVGFLVVASLLLAGVVGYMAWAGYREKLPRNTIYGIRTASTTRNDESWRRAHRDSAVYSAGAAFTFLVTALTVLVVDATEEESAIIWLVGSVIALVQIGIATRVAVRSATT